MGAESLKRSRFSPGKGVACLGVDIGGANLKYASSEGEVRSVEFPLWQRPERLADQLSEDLATFAPGQRLAATMTGELADCFFDRDDGICHIVDHLARAAEQSSFAPPLFYGVDGGFHSVAQARHQHRGLMAASNWHALGCFVARWFTDQGRWVDDQKGLLIDIGSTTTDLIPFGPGGVLTPSQTDFDRLCEGSLVYLGGGRTPVCSLIGSLEYRQRSVPVMREVFATMDDVRLLLGHESEAPGDLGSADGRPRDRAHAANRMARMIGLDHRDVTVDEAAELAVQVHRQARARVLEAVESLANAGLYADDSLLVVSGHAADLWPAASRPFRGESLVDHFGARVSRCAPAFAVASLLRARAL